MSGSFATGIAEEFDQYSGSVKEGAGRSTVMSELRFLDQRVSAIPAPFLVDSISVEAPPSSSQLEVPEAQQGTALKARILIK